MATITKAEYLAALQSEVAATSKKREKATKRKHIISAALGIGTAILIGLGMAGTSVERANNYKKFSAGEISATFEMLNEGDVFGVWNEQNLGNDINTLLGGGKILSHQGVLIVPSGDGNSVAIGGLDSGTIPGNISYINICNGIIYYREDATRKICSYDPQGGSATTVVDTNAGELLVADGRLYYVDRGDNNKVISADMNGQDRQTAVDHAVTSFVVCGNDIIYLGTDQTLYRKDGTDSTTTLMSNVERFFLNGNLVVESGDSVFQFTPERSHAVLLHQSSAEDMQLVGACSDGVFIQEGGKLLFSDGSNTATVAAGAPLLYQSVLLDKTGIVRYVTLSSMTDIHLGEAPLPELKGGN